MPRRADCVAVLRAITPSRYRYDRSPRGESSAIVMMVAATQAVMNAGTRNDKRQLSSWPRPTAPLKKA